MTNSTVGFTFKEVMAGGFSLGPSDPSAGEVAGRASGTMLTMHATMVIEDLDKLFADALHPGSISE
jgi:hypothetical protein